MEEIKSRGVAAAPSTLSLENAVLAATAAIRDKFRETVGSEPIACKIGDNIFAIKTYGAGKYLTVGQFGIAPMSGCCGMVVFFHASTTDGFRGKGLGRLFLQVREIAAKLAGYTVAQATVLTTNKSERKLLQDAGWKENHEFTNKRTSNKVVVCLKEL